MTPTEPEQGFWFKFGYWLGLSLLILAGLAKYVFWAAVLLVAYVLFT